ncbi:MAG: NAD(P)H-binding protein [Solirubrobacteraceae bacterium]
MRVLVTGITGFIGGALAPRLLAAGHELRGFARDPTRLPQPAAQIEMVTGDALTGRGLRRALDGVDAAYYLIHSLEPSSDGSLIERERRAADRFAAAVQAAGVQRVVYLGGLIPHDAPPGQHLASRLEVERVLLSAAPAAVALRASVVVGARGRSFRFLVRLVERMPMLILPAWRKRRTQPIDERDVLACLVGALELDPTNPAAPRSLDIAGPDVLSYGVMVQRIRDLLLLGRPTIGLGFTATPLASRVAAAVAGEAPELIGPLMAGLDHDLLPRSPTAADESAALFGVRRHSFDSAVEHALRELEQQGPVRAR